MNSTSDTVIVVTVICGLLMVVGGMVLLYKGTITLKDSNPEEAIRVEFKHMINVTTRYPALALFVIGLVFTLVASYFAQSQGIPPFKVNGKLVTDRPEDATVIICFGEWRGNPNSDGTISKSVRPEADNIGYRIVTPGYEPGEIVGSMTQEEVRHHGLSLESIKPGIKTDNQPKVNPENIVQAPPDLPLRDEGSKF